MAKGPGTTRNGGGGNPKGLSVGSTPREIINAKLPESLRQEIINAYKATESLTKDEKKNVTALSNPNQYIALSLTSPEKKSIIKALDSNLDNIDKGDSQTGAYGLWKVSDREYIRVDGLQIITGIVKEKSQSMRRNVQGSGIYRWYGGQESYRPGSNSESFSVYDSDKVESLLKRIKKTK